MKHPREERAIKLIEKMQNIAYKVGPIHAYWDIIFDFRGVLEGKDSVLGYSVEEYIKYVEDTLNKNAQKNKNKVRP